MTSICICKSDDNNIKSKNNFNRLLYNHIASIFRSITPSDDFIYLLTKYKEEYDSFADDTISTTLEEIYINFIQDLIVKNMDKLKKYFDEIYNFIDNLQEDISSFQSLPILIMAFDNNNISNINKITNYIQNLIENNSTLIEDYLINNIDKFI